MSSVVTVAVDVGSGFTKVLAQGASAEFPSLSGPPLPEVFSLTREPGAYVSFGGKEFCVGERALSAVRPSDIVDSRTDTWFRTDGYLALLYAGLGRVLPPGYSGRVALATGLPIGFFRDAKEALLERLVGEHRFAAGGAAFKVVVRKPDCWILPQALGLYMRHLELAPEAHAGRCGFIDVGTFTSGFLQTERFALLQYATGSARIGVGDVKAGLAEYLERTYRMTVTRSTVEGAMATGRIRVGTEWVDLREAIENIAMSCSEPCGSRCGKAGGRRRSARSSSAVAVRGCCSRRSGRPFLMRRCSRLSRPTSRWSKVSWPTRRRRPARASRPRWHEHGCGTISATRAASPVAVGSGRTRRRDRLARCPGARRPGRCGTAGASHRSACGHVEAMEACAGIAPSVPTGRSKSRKPPRRPSQAAAKTCGASRSAAARWRSVDDLLAHTRTDCSRPSPWRAERQGDGYRWVRRARRVRAVKSPVRHVWEARVAAAVAGRATRSGANT
jgi:plasmid segregation protein ParM